jgi:hypothetical protein
MSVSQTSKRSVIVYGVRRRRNSQFPLHACGGALKRGGLSLVQAPAVRMCGPETNASMIAREPLAYRRQTPWVVLDVLNSDGRLVPGVTLYTARGWLEGVGMSERQAEDWSI